MTDILGAFDLERSKGRDVALGIVSKVADGRVYAVLPTFNRKQEFGPMPCEHGADVAVGDRVLVGFDEQGAPWVIAWDGVAVGGGGDGTDPDAVHTGDAAGGVLSGTYPNPGFAADMATQAELDSEATARAGVQTNLNTHAALTTAAHGGIVSSADARLTDARTPTAHAASHASGGGDPLTLAQSQITNLTSDLALKAPLASPTLTGTPAAPTAAGGTNTTQIATTAYVQTELAAKAALASPTFTGDPKAPTPSAGDNDTSIATTAYVQTEIALVKPGIARMWVLA